MTGAACTFANPFVDGGGVTEGLARLEEAAAVGDWQRAAAELTALEDAWEAAAPWLAVHNDRRDVERFATGLRRLEIFVADREAQAVRLELVVMRETWGLLLAI